MAWVILEFRWLDLSNAFMNASDLSTYDVTPIKLFVRCEAELWWITFLQAISNIGFWCRFKSCRTERKTAQESDTKR